MGDGGKLYAHFNFHFVEKMRALCSEADFILPNVTEACLLAGENYPQNGEALPAEKIVQKLSSLHTCPIVTGVEEGEENAVYYTKRKSGTASRRKKCRGILSRSRRRICGGVYRVPCQRENARRSDLSVRRFYHFFYFPHSRGKR